MKVRISNIPTVSGHVEHVTEHGSVKLFKFVDANNYEVAISFQKPQDTPTVEYNIGVGYYKTREARDPAVVTGSWQMLYNSLWVASEDDEYFDYTHWYDTDAGWEVELRGALFIPEESGTKITEDYFEHDPEFTEYYFPILLLNGQKRFLSIFVENIHMSVLEHTFWRAGMKGGRPRTMLILN